MIFNSWSKRDFSNGRRGVVKVLDRSERIRQFTILAVSWVVFCLCGYFIPILLNGPLFNGLASLDGQGFSPSTYNRF